MDWLHIVVLAIIQGFTEFLPVSSSAHLILPAHLLGWSDQGLAFDVAVHLGSLLAVVAYFRQDILQLACAWCKSFTQGASEHSNLVWYIALATIPAGLVGLLGKDFIEQELRSPLVIAWATIGFGVLLGVADKFSGGAIPLAKITWKLALLIGLAQAMALIPGTSRSGITMTAALFLGFSRVDAARFSFLLSIPIISLSAGYLSYKLLAESNIDWLAMGAGLLLSAISAFICIFAFMQLISRMGMMPFVVYRLCLGAVLIALFI